MKGSRKDQERNRQLIKDTIERMEQENQKLIAFGDKPIKITKTEIAKRTGISRRTVTTHLTKERQGVEADF